MVAVSNFIAAYDVREGKILEWTASRLRMGVAVVNTKSGDYACSAGISISGLLQTAMNMDTIVTAYPIKISTGIRTNNWEYNATTQTLQASDCSSGNVVYSSGDLEVISGNSIVLQVFGT